MSHWLIVPTVSIPDSRKPRETGHPPLRVVQAKIKSVADQGRPPKVIEVVPAGAVPVRAGTRVGYFPVPARATDCVPTPSWICNVAVRVPAAVGVNVTEIVQLAPVRRVLLHADVKP